VAQTYLTDGTSVGVEIKGIIASLAGQLGLPDQAKSNLVIKLQRVDLYALSKANSDVRPAMTCDYSSLTPTLGDPQTPGAAEVVYPLLKRLRDIGGVSTAAKVSYTWPLSMRDIPLQQSANFVAFETSANVTEIDARIHLLWSTADVATPIPPTSGGNGGGPPF